MILSDKDIRVALKEKKLIINPSPVKFSTSAVDLRIGGPLSKWDPELVRQAGTVVELDVDAAQYSKMIRYGRKLTPRDDGSYAIEPGEFVLAPTHEKIGLPRTSKLAAWVEGRSTIARYGLSVHITAPVIHCGYGDPKPRPLTLEMVNYGPFRLIVHPNRTRICQLVIEKVTNKPSIELDTIFQKQTGPLSFEPE